MSKKLSLGVYFNLSNSIMVGTGFYIFCVHRIVLGLTDQGLMGDTYWWCQTKDTVTIGITVTKDIDPKLLEVKICGLSAAFSPLHRSLSTNKE